MSLRKNLSRRQKIKFRIRKRVIGTQERPRLIVFRSLKNIYAQLIDDLNSKTLLSISSLNKETKESIKDIKTKVSKSKLVGQALATMALDKNIKRVVFDRNGYLYHGRVKALAEGAREAGLKF